MRLTLHKVTKTYQIESEKKRGIEEVSFQVQEGTMVGIFGDSGCGKSTLFHLIAGILTPDAGEILIDGENLLQKPKKWRANYLNQSVGYIMQGNSLVSHLTVEQNLKLPYLFSDKESRKKIKLNKRIEEVLFQVNLVGYEKKYPGQLSGGEQNRVQIARALMQEPELILADEPTNGLDEKNAKNVMRILREVTKNGATVIVSTHQKEYLAECDFVYHCNWK